MPDVANILIGTGKLFLAPEGEPLPDITGDTITFAGNWLEMGFTEEGVEIEYTPEFFDAVVDQELTAVKKVLTAEAVVLRTRLAEADLDRLSKAIAGAAFSTIAQAAGQSAQDVVKIGGGTAAVKALAFEGKSPEGGFRIIFVHRAVSAEAVVQAYKKGEKTIFAVAFAALADTNKPAGEKLLTINDWTQAAL